VKASTSTIRRLLPDLGNVGPIPATARDPGGMNGSGMNPSGMNPSGMNPSGMNEEQT